MAPLLFQVTPWRHGDELLELRRDLYAASSSAPHVRQARVNAVNKVNAWRARKLELPLLLESTADLVEAVLRDEEGALPHHALRLLYATAVARFITGLSDTQTELTRLNPTLAPAFPPALREVRHRIVHRHLPSLSELKRAAQSSLEWLWEWYWSRLDAHLSGTAPARSRSQTRASSEAASASHTTITIADFPSTLALATKTYLRTRKLELKQRTPTPLPSSPSPAATTLTQTYLTHPSPRNAKLPILLSHLTTPPHAFAPPALLPQDRRLATTMHASFLLWTPFLLSLAAVDTAFLPALASALIAALAGTEDADAAARDPVREGLCAWVLRLCVEKEWAECRKRAKGGGAGVVEDVLSACFTAPSYWTVRCAAGVLERARKKEMPGRETWRAVLEAVRVEEGLEGVEAGVREVEEAVGVDMEVEEVEETEKDGETERVEVERPAAAVAEPVKSIARQKVRGPQRRPGLWKPRPIGWLPEGCVLDDVVAQGA